MIGHIEPYINFKGNARDAFTLYSKIFELKEPDLMTFRDLPPTDQGEMAGMMDPDQIMHGAVDFNGTYLMGADTTDEMLEEGKFIAGNNFYLSWSSEDKAAVQQVWDRFVEAGAEVIMPLAETFWAPLYGILKDPFGVSWMIQNWIRTGQPSNP